MHTNLQEKAYLKKPAKSNNSHETLPDSPKLDQHRTPTAGLQRTYTWNHCVHSNGLDESKQQCDSKENTIKSNDRLGLPQEQNSNMPEKHYVTS